MKFLKDRVVFHSVIKNEKDDKVYYSVRFYNQEGELETYNYAGLDTDILDHLVPGEYVNLHFNIYKDRDNYYRIAGLSIYKIDKCNV